MKSCYVTVFVLLPVKSKLIALGIKETVANCQVELKLKEKLKTTAAVKLFQGVKGQ
jgi:hypothetical protein